MSNKTQTATERFLASGQTDTDFDNWLRGFDEVAEGNRPVTLAMLYAVARRLDVRNERVHDRLVNHIIESGGDGNY